MYSPTCGSTAQHVLARLFHDKIYKCLLLFEKSVSVKGNRAAHELLHAECVRNPALPHPQMAFAIYALSLLVIGGIVGAIGSAMSYWPCL